MRTNERSKIKIFDKMEIESKEYDRSGNKREQNNYSNGKVIEVYEYYENGDKQLVSYFKKGKPTGIWMSWDKDGDYDWINMDLHFK